MVSRRQQIPAHIANAQTSRSRRVSSANAISSRRSRADSAATSNTPYGGRANGSTPRNAPTARTRERRNTAGKKYVRRGSHTSNATNNRRRRPRNGGGKRRHLVLKWVLGILAALLAMGVAAFAYLYATTEVPPPEKMAMAAKTTVYYSDGTTQMGSFAEQNRDIIECSTLPKYVGESIVASENRTFYQDRGIDLKGIVRALLNNVTGGARQGASTITQQYAERYYLGQTDTYAGKVHEAILALKINKTQSKDQVLCNYMNTIYLGRGAYGIQAASKVYFNKDAKDLTAPESALLAGIIPAPSNWDPAINPQMAQKRYTRVIDAMRDADYISPADADKAKTMPSTQPLRQQPNWYAGPQGYLLQMVREELTNSKTFTKNDLDTGGYTIVTTIDKTKQDTMFDVASPTKGGAGIVPAGLQIGGISANVKNGDIEAVYAGDDYLTKQYNNATQATYEPGSTMKPFALLGAVEAGVNLNTTFNGNSPRTYAGIATPVQNYGNTSWGYSNLYKATADSINTVYMDVQEHLGAKKVAQIAQTAGMDPKLVTGDNPFTVLGNDGVHVKDVAQAYATIANQGNKPTLHIVASVKDSSGNEMYRAPVDTEQVFSANDTGLVAKAMTGTIQYGTAYEARRIGKTIAGKSGSANDDTAGSFVGFTPNIVTVFATWNPDANGNPQVVPRFGRFTDTAAYPIHLFTEYMSQVLEGTPNQDFPAVKDTGKIGGPDGKWGTGAPSGTNGGFSQPYRNSANTNPGQQQQSQGEAANPDDTNAPKGNETGSQPGTVPNETTKPDDSPTQNQSEGSAQYSGQ
ncbi:transglycosylase domain-containing protein [Bifidobacterium bombi]|uniref:Membrane carboxypeptidase (Penicillin-binding protein) n=1 Tax=Bifidobacterium bombi DSM 19703 TaxID=1341695 RepID=A0A086BNE9_9BIFI|nr:membrane carboxypeptidase (penicillin-binding protein) [Bifidobacterium bombi DSM 19703]